MVILDDLQRLQFMRIVAWPIRANGRDELMTIAHEVFDTQKL